MSQIPEVLLYLILLIARIESAGAPAPAPTMSADFYHEGRLTGIVRLHRPIRPTDRTYRISVESSEFEPYSLTVEQSETVSHLFVVHGAGDDEPRVLDLSPLLSQIAKASTTRDFSIDVQIDRGVTVAFFVRRPYGLIASVPEERIFLIVADDDR